MTEEEIESKIVAVHDEFKSRIDEYPFNPLIDKNNLTKAVTYVKRTTEILKEFIQELNNETISLLNSDPDKTDLIFNLRHHYIDSLVKQVS